VTVTDTDIKARGVALDLPKVQAVLDRARATAVSEGTFAIGYLTLFCGSEEEVDAIASQWDTRTEWVGGQYRAGWTDGVAHLAAVYIPQPGAALESAA